MTSSPTRVLFVSISLADGGAERVLSTLLARLDRTQFAPSVCVLRDQRSYWIPPDVSVFNLNKRRPWHLPRAVSQLRAVINEVRPHLLVSMVAIAGVITYGALKRMNHRPAWLARLGIPASRHSGFNRWCLPAVCRDADALIANSNGVRSDLLQFAAGTSVVRLNNPVEFGQFELRGQQQIELQKPSDRPLILAAARLHRAKRYDVLLDAFAQLRHRMNSHLWICGEGPLRGQIERTIDRYNLSDDVRILGFRTDLHSIMSHSDLFVSTSDEEGSPNTLIEAQGLGLPAVATRCPCGPDEILHHGHTGLLVPTADHNAVATAMESLLNNPNLLKSMSREAKVCARIEFDADKVIPQWETCLRNFAVSTNANDFHRRFAGPVVAT